MAIDEVLMESVRSGGAPTLRFYRWSPACLSLGRNQPVPDPETLSRLRTAGIDVVRRPTGGRAVLHDDELTYAVVCADRELGPPREAYQLINGILVDALSRLGARAAIQGETAYRAPPPDSTPCFASPVEGEVLAMGRKLVGSAQVRIGAVLLQHGSLPFRPGRASEFAAEYLHLDSEGAPAYLERALGELPPWQSLVDSISAVWTEQVAPAEPSELTPEEGARAEVLAEVYQSEVWTGRR